ncbi:hypothetical protein [Nocardia sp. NPDC056952]|uniref:hypothetical protein n=1 Tax=unclassified Nocardia TaxID=2637762 RepID=UPI00362D4AB6
MSHNMKALLLVAATLTSVIGGIAGALLVRADGATVASTIRAGGITFGGTLTLLMLAMTTYIVL